MSIQCPPGTTQYMIRAGDTLFSLAARYNTTVQAILTANPGLDPNSLQIGRIICMPGTQPVICPSGTFSYTIQAGDTFHSLAARYNTTVQAIQAANPGVDPNRLFIGQVICIPGTPPQTCPAGTFSYTIKAGDNFYNLAIKYNTTVQAIQAANPGVDPNRLFIGQVICIPGTPPQTCPAGTFSYTIKAGDNFYSLAIKYNTTVQAVQAANPGVDPNRLFIGQVICIPGTPPQTCPAGTFSYTIKAGDNFYSLAIKYNTTVQAIQAANPGVDPNRLFIGQVICIPGSQPGSCPTGTFPYIIRPGDTFFSIAARFGTTVQAIQAANPGVDPNRLTVGEVICVP